MLFRQALQAQVLVAGEGWHGGVMGVVAGRLKEKFHRPALVVSIDKAANIGRGSARSIQGVDLGAIMHKARHQGWVSARVAALIVLYCVVRRLLLQGGGHAMAAGFAVRLDKMEDFRKFLVRAVASFGLNAFVVRRPRSARLAWTPCPCCPSTR